MDDLVQWLRAQLDEDERTARAATLGPWMQSGIGDYGWTVDFGCPGTGVETANTEQGLADVDFIAAHNPARVLREIDAKRQVIEQYESIGSPPPGEIGTELSRAELGRVLRLLALPYEDRPGYREEWRP
jgi:hypothetical protein